MPPISGVPTEHGDLGQVLWDCKEEGDLVWSLKHEFEKQSRGQMQMQAPPLTALGLEVHVWGSVSSGFLLGQ